MQEALRLIDDADAPPQLGAHLDLAICRLRVEVALRTNGAATPAESMRLGNSLPD
jgi:hypothetical protein